MPFRPQPDIAAPPEFRVVRIPDAIDARPATIRLRVALDINRRPIAVTLADGGGHAVERISHWLHACQLITAALIYDARAGTETTCRMEHYGDSILAAVAKAARG